MIADPRYDFEANLRMADLQQNGLRGYNYRLLLQKNNNDVEKAVGELEILDKNLQGISTSGAYTKEMKSMITGEGKQTIEDLGGENIVEGLERFEELTNGNENYKFDWDAYNTRENDYFNTLVGIETKVGG